MNSKFIIAGLAGTILLASGIYLSEPEYTTIEWKKPTTDAEWMEDVKAENFDLKSTGVLNEMLSSHIKKLEQVSQNFKEYKDFPDYMKFQIKSNSTLTDAEVNEIYQQRYQDFLFTTEKLAQSIERMEMELDLRKRGVVVPD